MWGLGPTWIRKSVYSPLLGISVGELDRVSPAAVSIFLLEKKVCHRRDEEPVSAWNSSAEFPERSGLKLCLPPRKRLFLPWAQGGSQSSHHHLKKAAQSTDKNSQSCLWAPSLYLVIFTSITPGRQLPATCSNLIMGLIQQPPQTSLQVGSESLTDTFKSCFPGKNFWFLAHHEQIDVCMYIIYINNLKIEKAPPKQLRGKHSKVFKLLGCQLWLVPSSKHHSPLSPAQQKLLSCRKMSKNK